MTGKNKHMKNILTGILILCFFSASIAQDLKTFNVNDQELELTYEEKGELSLLSYYLDREVRFFLEKNNELIELTEDNYKETLTTYASNADLNIMTLRYNVRDLVKVVRKHNGGNNDYTDHSDLRVRLGALGGLGNFSEYSSLQNPTNTNIPFFGAEAEVYSETQYLRSAGFFQVRHAFGNDDFDLTQTEFVLGYRFKFINTSWFHLYGETELISLFNYKLTYLDDTLDFFEEPTLITDQGFQLGTPVSLGLGMAIKLFNETYLTLNYSNMIRLGEPTRSDFPVDVRAGIKFRL